MMYVAWKQKGEQVARFIFQPIDYINEFLFTDNHDVPFDKRMMWFFGLYYNC